MIPPVALGPRLSTRSLVLAPSRPRICTGWFPRSSAVASPRAIRPLPTIVMFGILLPLLIFGFRLLASVTQWGAAPCQCHRTSMTPIMPRSSWSKMWQW